MLDTILYYYYYLITGLHGDAGAGRVRAAAGAGPDLPGALRRLRRPAPRGSWQSAALPRGAR